MKTPIFVLTVFILSACFGLDYLDSAKHIALDPGTIETMKSIKLIIVGYWFGSASTAAANHNLNTPDKP